ncbi:MAG: TrkH family potassium uptake protein [Acidimicrobiia bacterium]|nr:MAG: TrkH family potassium uptake protein [Acidimicrobiia bacterium]
MSWRHLLHVVGAVLGAVGVSMFAPAVAGAIYQEWSELPGLLIAAAITTLIGYVLWRIFDRPGELSTREGFAAVGLSWIAMAIAGALPYLLTGSIGNPTDAIFESAAGITTTGASIVSDPALLSHGVLLWRSLTQWIGGMGIIVLSVAILPLLGMGAVQLVRAESPGPMPDRLTPRFRETAKRLWFVYVALTGIEILFLWVGDMTLFEAVNHSFTTMSTGGFSTNAGSIGAFSVYSQWVIIVFMALAGMSFALHYKVVRRDPKAYLRSGGLRVYLGIVLIAAFLMAVGTWGGPISKTIRDAIFTSLTIVTTTGFATVDFALWIPALGIVLVGLMFVGGMAGSTAGAIKSDRLQILYEASRTDVRRLIHPRGVFVTRVGKNPVPDLVVETVQTFFLLYMFAFMTGTFLLAIIGSMAGLDLDIVTTVSAVASSLGNVGPGLGDVGPTSTYAAIPAPGKWLLSSLMIIGRLEILPILILFNREVWRK